MTSRVQDGEQPVATATTAPARPVLYEDALFLLLAEGRVPTRSELLVFLLGFAASVSFQRRTDSEIDMRLSKNSKRVYDGTHVVIAREPFASLVVCDHVQLMPGAQITSR